MTEDDARSLLGVDRDADANGVRRAYLRLLRLHKPETDPEGFQRLREAFELLKPPSRVISDDDSAMTTVTSVAEDTAAPVPEPQAARREQDPRARVFWDRIRALHPHTLERERGVLMEAVAACPEDVGLRLALAYVHEELGGIGAAVEVLREGAALGLTECVDELVSVSPQSLDPEWLQQATERLPALRVAHGYAAAGQPQRAAEIVRAALAPERWLGSAMADDCAASLRVAVQLMAAGHGALGRELGGEVLRAAETAGVERRAAHWDPVGWQVSREFLLLDPPMPHELELRAAGAIAGGVRPDFGSLADTKVSYAEWSALRTRLYREAPTLRQFIDFVGPGPRSTMGWFGWVILVLLALKLAAGLIQARDHRHGAASREDAEHQRFTPASEYTHPPRSVGADSGPPVTVTDPEARARLVSRARAAADEICERTDGQDCFRATSMVSAFERGDCEVLSDPHATQAQREAQAFYYRTLPMALRVLVHQCERPRD